MFQITILRFLPVRTFSDVMILSLIFLKKYLFILDRERDRDRERAEEGQREGDTESETGFRLQVVSTEPDAGLEPTTVRS